MSGNKFNEAVRWFVGLESSKKAQIIEDPSSFSEEEQDLFFVIVREVQRWLAQDSKENVIKRLRELGFGTFGDALVEKILEYVPPIEYSIRLINKLDHEEFRNLVKNYITSSFLGSESLFDLCKRLNINDEFCLHFDHIFRSYIFELLAGDVNFSQMQGELEKSGLKEEYVTTLLKCIKENESEIWKKAVYSIVWHRVLPEIRDMARRVNELDRRVNEVISLLRDFLESLRGGRAPPPEMFR